MSHMFQSFFFFKSWVPAQVSSITRKQRDSSGFRTVRPDSAASEAIVFLSDRSWQLVLRLTLQVPPDAVLLELGSARVSNQDFGAVALDAQIQPAVKAGGKGLVVEHVAQQDQVKGFSLTADHVFREAHRRLNTVQFTVHLCGDSRDCNTKKWHFQKYRKTMEFVPTWNVYYFNQYNQSGKSSN